MNKFVALVLALIAIMVMATSAFAYTISEDTDKEFACVTFDTETFPASPNGNPPALFYAYYLPMIEDAVIMQAPKNFYHIFEDFTICGLSWETQYHISVFAYAESGTSNTEEYTFPLWVYTGIDDTTLHNSLNPVETDDIKLYVYAQPNQPPAPHIEPVTAVSPPAVLVRDGDNATYNIRGKTYMVEVAPLQVGSEYPKYVRKDWGRGWKDFNKNCRSTRHDVLVDESLIEPTFKTQRQCSVVSGKWYGVFTGETFTRATQVDIDHMVPLSNAHKSGGWAWDRQKKSEFYNYVGYDNHLLAVKKSANRQKGDKSPDRWKPPLASYHCQYAINWLEIKHQWELTVTQQESEALEVMLKTCD